MVPKVPFLSDTTSRAFVSDRTVPFRTLGGSRALYAASPVVMHRGLEEVKLQRVFSSCWWINPHLHGRVLFRRARLGDSGSFVNNLFTGFHQ
jgi:hypothetical protein